MIAREFVIMNKGTLITLDRLEKMKTCLGAWAKPNEPFKDANGKWYVRDAKGTVRRCKINTK
jgi:hypothetical protein